MGMGTRSRSVAVGRGRAWDGKAKPRKSSRAIFKPLAERYFYFGGVT